MAAGLMALALPTTCVPAVTARCDVTYRVLYLRMMILPSIHLYLLRARLPYRYGTSFRLLILQKHSRTATFYWT